MSRKDQKLKRRINEFGASVGMSPAKIAFSLILAVGLGVFIWFVAFPGSERYFDSPQPVSAQKKKDTELSIDQRLEYLLNAKPPSVRNFLMVIEEMKARTKELTEIELENELTSEQKSKADLIRIKNGGVIVGYMLENNIDHEVEWAEFQKLCIQHVDDADELVQEAANYWLGLIPLIEFSRNPDEATYESFTKNLSNHGRGFLGNPSHALIYSNWIKSMRRTNQPKEFIIKGHNFLGEQLSKSELPNVKILGQQMSQLALYGGFDLPSLGSRISWQDPSAAADLAGALATLKENVSETKFEVWATVVRAYENFLATDNIEGAGETWKLMSNLVAGLPESETKTGMQAILKNQQARALKIGTKFDVSGFAFPNDEPFDASGQEYTLIVFCQKSQPESQEFLGKLKVAISQSQPNYSPVLVFEEELNEADRQSMPLVPKIVKVASRETVLKYLADFPVDFFPYLILIDKEGTLVSANLDIDQVPNRIAKIEARRKANANAGQTTGR